MTDYPSKDSPLLDRLQDIVGNHLMTIIGLSELAIDGDKDKEIVLRRLIEQSRETNKLMIEQIYKRFNE